MSNPKIVQRRASKMQLPPAKIKLVEDYRLRLTQMPDSDVAWNIDARKAQLARNIVDAEKKIVNIMHSGSSQDKKEELQSSIMAVKVVQELLQAALEEESSRKTVVVQEEVQHSQIENEPITVNSLFEKYLAQVRLLPRSESKWIERNKEFLPDTDDKGLAAGLKIRRYQRMRLQQDIERDFEKYQEEYGNVQDKDVPWSDLEAIIEVEVLISMTLAEMMKRKALTVKPVAEEDSGSSPNHVQEGKELS